MKVANGSLIIGDEVDVGLMEPEFRALIDGPVNFVGLTAT